MSCGLGSVVVVWVMNKIYPCRMLLLIGRDQKPEHSFKIRLQECIQGQDPSQNVRAEASSGKNIGDIWAKKVFKTHHDVQCQKERQGLFKLYLVNVILWILSLACQTGIKPTQFLCLTTLLNLVANIYVRSLIKAVQLKKMDVYFKQEVKLVRSFGFMDTITVNISIQNLQLARILLKAFNITGVRMLCQHFFFSQRG